MRQDLFDQMIENLFDYSHQPYGVKWENKDKELVGYVEMPGVKKEDLKLHVSNGTLEITGERKKPTTKRYQRSIALSDEIDLDKIDASLQDGILTIRLAIKDSVQPKMIEVK